MKAVFPNLLLFQTDKRLSLLQEIVRKIPRSERHLESTQALSQNPPPRRPHHGLFSILHVGLGESWQRCGQEGRS